MSSIDLASVPQHSRDDLAGVLIRAVNAFFQRPGEEEKFQAWLAEYRKAEQAT